jgi:hypothetical protein
MAMGPSRAERRTKVGPGIGHTPNLARCLQLNALALAFSLAHMVADYGVIFDTSDFNTWGVAAYLGLAGAVYGWWGWSMAQAVRGSRAALLSLLALSGIWAVLHGASFPFTPLTLILADIIHFGSLLFGLWAAYATWRVLRAGRPAIDAGDATGAEGADGTRSLRFP